MNHNSHTVLHIDLENQSSEIKNHTDLTPFLGGYGIGLKLLEQNLESDPLVFSIGPFTTAFPYDSKTCAIALKGQIKSSYVGGGVGAAVRFAGLDTIIIKGKSSFPIYLTIKNQEVVFHRLETTAAVWRDESLLGQVSFLEVEQELLVDRYFKFSGYWLREDLEDRNLKAIVVSGTKSLPIENMEAYQKIFKALLMRSEEVEVAASDKRSCFACPLGCERSFEGDIYPTQSLSKFLISCRFAPKIYDDIPTIFACLNALGYSYSHEELEGLPNKVVRLEKEIGDKMKTI